MNAFELHIWVAEMNFTCSLFWSIAENGSWWNGNSSTHAMASTSTSSVLQSSRRQLAVKYVVLELFADAEVHTADVGIGLTSAPAEGQHVS